VPWVSTVVRPEHTASTEPANTEPEVVVLV
jgi:hypothetical protein